MVYDLSVHLKLARTSSRNHRKKRSRARQGTTKCRTRSRWLPAEGGNPTGIRRNPFRIPVCSSRGMRPPNRESLTSPERASFFRADQVQRTQERKDKRADAQEECGLG